MHRTGWSKPGGSLPSDRIRPQQPSTQQSKGKGKAAPAGPPKSRAVGTLESLADGIRKSSGRDKDPKGGCFCQARQHDLSSYVPLCQQCGLILCMLNLPYYACPHCSGVLLDAFHPLEEELSRQIAKEEAERQRAIDEARIAAGAFPMLPGSQSPRASPPPPPQTHKVLSLNSKTKRVTVSSYTNSPVPSRPASRSEDVVPEEQQRVPPPPHPARPWVNLRVGELRYVAAPGDTSRTPGHSGGRRRRKEGGER
ncbi:hypothetical protein BU15DRAFT_89038 [Melanogaster broomeanus]|nr:hypothetical protein BU15DRAFT_89038 [Melanogaster broomeanus]